MKSRRKFTKEFKLTAIRRLQGGQSIAEVARALEVHPSELHRWRRELEDYGEQAFSGVGKKRVEESRVAELERKVGQPALEIDVLKRALQHVEEQRLRRARNNGAHSTSPSRKKGRPKRGWRWARCAVWRGSAGRATPGTGNRRRPARKT